MFLIPAGKPAATVQIGQATRCVRVAHSVPDVTFQTGMFSEKPD